MPRTPLGPISGNRVKKKELNPSARGFLAGAVASSATFASIKNTFGTPESTTRFTLSLASLRNNHTSRPRTGRLQATSDRDQRYIIRLVRINPRITYAELKSELGLKYKRSTIYRILKHYGLKN